MYFRICPHCGANLDPGETCDCESKSQVLAEKWKCLLETAEDGQLELKEMEAVLNG